MVKKRESKRKYKEYVRRCVECDSTSFHKDYKLGETSCLRCGLVLFSPYSPDFVTDGFVFEEVE